MSPLLAAALAALVAAAAVAVLRRCAGRLPHALPGERTLHARPVPRVGGLAILAGILAALPVAPPALPGPPAVTALAVAAVALVSLADDARGVPPALRLAVHLAAAAAVSVGIFGATREAALAALALAWSANLYNFMDGSDGLAGAMTVVGYGTLAAGAVVAGASPAFLLAVVAAALPFLAANRPPASLFMGDVGAVTLGFLAAALGAAGVAGGTWPAWFPLLAFLPFVADASATLARRALRGEALWRAHRGHYYQRLHVAGAGHAGTLAVYGAAMLACGALAVAVLALAPQAGWAALGAAALAHAGLFAAIVYHARISARGS